MSGRRPPLRDWPLIDLAGLRCPLCATPVARHPLAAPWRPGKAPLEVRTLGGGYYCNGTDPGHAWPRHRRPDDALVPWNETPDP